jgi:nitrogen-specific signal transduction histidine kinase
LTRRGLTVTALRAGRARRTVRLRLTLWSGGLFLICGTVLLAVTYGVVVQAFMALQEHAAVLHELLTRSEIALAVTAALSVALGWFIAGRALRPLRTITTAARGISAIPAAAVDRLFRPFQRLGADRTSRGEGSGLGLSIVQAIADAHGADITSCPQPGGGLLVEVTFPDPSSPASTIRTG